MVCPAIQGRTFPGISELASLGVAVLCPACCPSWHCGRVLLARVSSHGAFGYSKMSFGGFLAYPTTSLFLLALLLSVGVDIYFSVY